MTGYDASVWNSPETRILVIGPNWLGDGIMAMPALQVLRERLHARAVLDVGVKPGQAGLWRMNAAPGEVLILTPAVAALRANIQLLKERAYTHAVILPNSFRSALAPFLAGIPARRGTAGQLRRLLISDPVRLSGDESEHQQWENAELLLGDLPAALPAPRLLAPAAARERAAALLQETPGPHLALIPGAARGPSKRWPGERFAAVAAGWNRETGGSVIWLGTGEDQALCLSLAKDLPPSHSLLLAGKTGMDLFAALLQAVRGVVANDSGGMHLAAALGTPVAAIFGLTNPRKTGPLHPAAAVFQHADKGSRAIARDSDAARMALEAVTADEVLERVLAFPPRKA